MKKLLLAILILLGLLTIHGAAHAQSMTPGPVTVPDPQIITATLTTLLHDPPAAPTYYSISNYHQIGDYYMVSVAGVMTTNWTITDTIWADNLILYHDSWSDAWSGAIPGTLTYTNYIQYLGLGTAGAGGLDPLDPNNGFYAPDASVMFPFQNGSDIYYGPGGVHQGWGPSFMGVDLFPWNGADDAIYAAASGSVSYVCRDNSLNELSAKIGKYYYVHLVDNGMQEGDYYSQGEPISRILYGTFTSQHCGSAVQNDKVAHLHFAFENASHFTMGSWTLDTSSQEWSNGSKTVSPGSCCLKAEGGSPDNPPPGNDPKSDAASNFWGLILKACKKILTTMVYGISPSHTQVGIADTVVKLTSTSLGLIFILFFAQINMIFPLACLGIILILEVWKGGFNILKTIMSFVKMFIPFL